MAPRLSARLFMDSSSALQHLKVSSFGCSFQQAPSELCNWHFFGNSTELEEKSLFLVPCPQHHDCNFPPPPPPLQGLCRPFCSSISNSLHMLLKCSYPKAPTNASLSRQSRWTHRKQKTLLRVLSTLLIQYPAQGIPGVSSPATPPAWLLSPSPDFHLSTTTANCI